MGWEYRWLLLEMMRLIIMWSGIIPETVLCVRLQVIVYHDVVLFFSLINLMSLHSKRFNMPFVILSVDFLTLLIVYITIIHITLMTELSNDVLFHYSTWLWMVVIDILNNFLFHTHTKCNLLSNFVPTLSLLASSFLISNSFGLFINQKMFLISHEIHHGFALFQFRPSLFYLPWIL